LFYTQQPQLTVATLNHPKNCQKKFNAKKREIMDVINQIISQSAIGTLSNWYKSVVLLVFSSIVVTLFTMLVILLANASHLTTNFSYLFNGNI